MDEEALLQELGRRMRTRRKEIGLSQEALALRANVDRSYYGAVERGERNVTFTMLCRLCAALECDLGVISEGLLSR